MYTVLKIFTVLRIRSYNLLNYFVLTSTMVVTLRTPSTKYIYMIRFPQKLPILTDTRTYCLPWQSKQSNKPVNYHTVLLNKLYDSDFSGLTSCYDGQKITVLYGYLLIIFRSFESFLSRSEIHYFKRGLFIYNVDPSDTN